MITILDYGAGNLRSVQNTLDEVGCEYKMVNDAAGVRAASSLILPGVGHFGQMMQALDRMEVREALVGRIRDGVPYFGICLGMQALFEGSEEAPEVRGLGVFPGVVRRFPGGARVPHMGWNRVSPAGAFVYFAHSYYVPEVSVASEICEYAGVRFTAGLKAGNIQGVQYHPEKSGAVGLGVVKNIWPQMNADERG